MRYQTVRRAVFLSRPNRFVALCRLDGEEILVHVKNTGRCRELLVPGAWVWLEQAPPSSGRKTAWSLTCVEKLLKNGESLLINMDSQAPNAAALEAAREGRLPFTFLENTAPLLLRREAFFEDSRFDLYGETEKERFFIEVKGVTLERGGGAYFPDAPTQRGIRHLEGLCRAVRKGYRCGVLFVVQMQSASFFAPNDETHPAFGEELRRARAVGVELAAMCCHVTPERMDISHSIAVRL